MTSPRRSPAAPAAEATPARPRNKQGQVLGPKGQQTRARLMECGRQLLDRQSPADLTAVAIAKAAGLTIGAYYLYFDDVADLLYELSCVASEDMAGVHRVVTDEWDADAPPGVNARRLVDAFLGVWNAHRPVLLYLDLEAHRGNERFAELRIASIRPIVAALGARIYEAGLAERRRSRGDARLEAMLLVTAMTGFAGADPAHSEREFGLERIARILTDMIARALASAPQTDAVRVEK